jgi:hypothetical protein
VANRIERLAADIRRVERAIVANTYDDEHGYRPPTDAEKDARAKSYANAPPGQLVPPQRCIRRLSARANHPGASLENLHDPSAMPKDLFAAHIALDKGVDSFLGVPDGALELDRQRLLLERYAKYLKFTASSVAVISAPSRQAHSLAGWAGYTVISAVPRP